MQKKHTEVQALTYPNLTAKCLVVGDECIATITQTFRVVEFDKKGFIRKAPTFEVPFGKQIKSFKLGN